MGGGRTCAPRLNVICPCCRRCRAARAATQDRAEAGKNPNAAYTMVKLMPAASTVEVKQATCT